MDEVVVVELEVGLQEDFDALLLPDQVDYIKLLSACVDALE